MTLRELEQLLAQDPNHIAARVGRALLWLQSGREGEALAELLEAERRAPRDPKLAALLPGVFASAGQARFERGDFHGAARAFQEQLKRAPRSRDAAFNLAMALERAGAFEVAVEVLEDAVRAGHDDAAMLTELASRKAQACDWLGLHALAARLRERIHAGAGALAGHPQLTLYLDGFGPAEQRLAAEAWARARFPSTGARPPRAPRRSRLRVGVVSGEVRDHPTAHLIAAMLEERDRERFEYVAYSYARDDASAARQRLIAAFDRFEDVAALDDDAIAARIRADAPDVLVDLAGYIRDARPGILARRPARIQGHFLGYPGPLGAPFVDFLVADAQVVAAGEERHYRERILRMPRCYQPNDPRRAAGPTPTRAACGLPGSGVVFGHFNQPLKVGAALFARWCALLRAVPGSCLWIGAFHAPAEARMREAAAAQGVDPSRLVVAPRVPQAEHIARLPLVDIALDTFPYTSHTTASDMLWAGVPLQTIRGDTFASRVAASVLTAARLADWVHDDPLACDAATLALATDPAALAAARERARAARHSPLFDARQFARDFEALLLEAAALDPED